MHGSSRYGQKWCRDELILALELYCRIPFSRTKASNPRVRRVASAIGRTPASVARKLGNFGAFDPELKKRKITGLGHGSKLDQAIWTEFNDDWSELVSQAEAIRLRLKFFDEPDTVWEPPSGPSERPGTRKQRLHQSFFRDAVLSSYVGRCAVTGISIGECLVASHIVPWSESVETRANPMNGICLSATIDCLFDRGLLTFRDDLTVALSPKITTIKEEPVQSLVACYDNRPMLRPERFLPDRDFLAWHREHRFHST